MFFSFCLARQPLKSRERGQCKIGQVVSKGLRLLPACLRLLNKYCFLKEKPFLLYTADLKSWNQYSGDFCDLR